MLLHCRPTFVGFIFRFHDLLFFSLCFRLLNWFSFSFRVYIFLSAVYRDSPGSCRLFRRRDGLLFHFSLLFLSWHLDSFFLQCSMVAFPERSCGSFRTGVSAPFGFARWCCWTSVAGLTGERVSVKRDVYLLAALRQTARTNLSIVDSSAAGTRGYAFRFDLDRLFECPISRPSFTFFRVVRLESPLP